MRNKNNISVRNIDLLGLKRKGLSNKKISKMLNIPIKKVDKFIKFQSKIKEYSGVF